MAFDMSSAAIGFAREALLDGDAETAAGAVRPLVAQGQGGPEARYWLASALIAGGEAQAGAAMLDQARTAHTLEVIAPMGADLAQLGRDGEYAAGVATKLYGGANVALSSAVWAMALTAGHRSAPGWLTHGLALQHQGRSDEAIAAFRATLDAWPSAAAHQFLLYPHLMGDDRLRRYGIEARAWAERWAPASATAPDLPRRPLAGRRLRIGYVSPSFATTQIHQFIAPVIEAHDREAVEVFLYPAKADGEDLWRAPIAIRPIGHLNDDDATALIRSDGIDVLVDCWGHSAGSRLPLFARRCAPVQAAWINFVQTTGVAAMDYLLHAGPEGAPFAHPLFGERIWPIGPVFNVFRPAADRPATGPTPALAGAPLTFGSFNHPCKLSDETVAAWGRILKRRPQARLFLKYGYFADPVLRRATQARFAAHGVAPERIVFEGRTSGAEYLAAFGAVDLALDPWPAPGSTTTLEALSNGVPVLTLSPAHSEPGQQYGRTLVSAVGQGDLAVDDWDAYVARALELTADLGALNQRRAKVRAGFDAGPLRDEVGFTRRVEAALRAMAETARGQARDAA